MARKGEAGGTLKLHVPLDASEVEGFKPDKGVKVAVVDSRGVVVSKTAELDAKGQGHAAFSLDDVRGALRVIVGPGDAADEDLVHLQTIVRDVPVRGLQGPDLKLPPIRISPFYWWWWWRWCRTFTITGRLLCPDGSPVPGAKVCAFDADGWWWWSSLQQVGCAVTDANGAFTIQFRWCCGWWPWWWWRLREWQLNPRLVGKILPQIERLPRVVPPVPSPKPTLGALEGLLSDGAPPTGPDRDVDVAALPALRDRLAVRVPATPELERLRIWPWWPWQPWWDCTPDIVFRATQVCQGQERVIVDEDVWDARWDVPVNLNVTLTASKEACCIHDPPTPEGNCVVIASVCDDLLGSIGGNPGAPAAPAGYLNPGAVAVFGDRPYAGAAVIAGLFGSGADVDEYEFEWSPYPAGPWSAMPAAAAGGFKRWYWGPLLGGGPVGFHDADFPFQPIDGRLVIESREHFEETHDPLSWGLTRFWVANRDVLMVWNTGTTFADGVYRLRLVGYKLVNPAKLGPRQDLPLCDTKDGNGLALAIDNSTSPLEPAADVVDVRINGVSAGPCSNVDASKGGVLDVDFVAYDVDRHLAYYSLIATYDKNLYVNLLSAPGATLTPVALGAIPAADFPGPDYGAARVQGAAAPNWRAGGLRLHIPDLRDAFPETCCYQLELRVYKRTVVSCNHDYTPWKLSYYSLTVVV